MAQEVLQIKPEDLIITRCPKCGASVDQTDSYDSDEGKLILVCLICGEEWPHREASNDCYANGEKIPKELPF